MKIMNNNRFQQNNSNKFTAPVAIKTFAEPPAKAETCLQYLLPELNKISINKEYHTLHITIVDITATGNNVDPPRAWSER